MFLQKFQIHQLEVTNNMVSRSFTFHLLLLLSLQLCLLFTDLMLHSNQRTFLENHRKTIKTLISFQMRTYFTQQFLKNPCLGGFLESATGLNALFISQTLSPWGKRPPAVIKHVLLRTFDYYLKLKQCV